MEVWKTIKDYPDYEISNLGRLKSLKFNKERILKLNINSTGYFTCRLQNNRKGKTFDLHKLVAIAFLNHIPCGYKLVINHKNFIKIDNRVENLEIVTARENCNLKHIKSSSKYVGVSWEKNNNKWKSMICINGKRTHLGYFINEIDASIKYEQELLKIKSMIK